MKVHVQPQLREYIDFFSSSIYVKIGHRVDISTERILNMDFGQLKPLIERNVDSSDAEGQNMFWEVMVLLFVHTTNCPLK